MQHPWFLRIGKSTVYMLIPEIWTVLYDTLNQNYSSFPIRDGWLNMANEFSNNYEFPKCLGAIDGKHFRIKRPVLSGSCFYNFKKLYSIVLIGTCDDHYRFIRTTIGDFGKKLTNINAMNSIYKYRVI